MDLSRYKYRRTVAGDGYFGAEHMKMRCPDADVSLTDGNDYFVTPKPYKDYIKNANDVQEVIDSFSFVIAFLTCDSEK